MTSVETLCVDQHPSTSRLLADAPATTQAHALDVLDPRCYC